MADWKSPENGSPIKTFIREYGKGSFLIVEAPIPVNGDSQIVSVLVDDWEIHRFSIDYLFSISA